MVLSSSMAFTKEKETEREREELERSLVGLRACNGKYWGEALKMKKQLEKSKAKTRLRKRMLREYVVMSCLTVKTFNDALKTAMAIKSVEARDIRDSRGNPTIEVDLRLFDGTLVNSSVSSGQPYDVRGDDNAISVLKAVNYVNTVIGPALVGEDPMDQDAIDSLIIQQLDRTSNKWGFGGRKLGANVMLAVSIAVCKAGAHVKGIPLYDHIADLAENNNLVLPVPAYNAIKRSMQEFMIIPLGASSFKDARDMNNTVFYSHLQRPFIEEFGLDKINYHDEGSLSPNIQGIEGCMKLLKKAIADSGYVDKVFIGLDMAASDSYDVLDKTYQLSFHEEKISVHALEGVYKSLVSEYPIVSIEHPFHQHDLEHFSNLTNEIGQKVVIMGDDLLVMNQKRLEEEIEKRTCNALHLKVNQIGSLTLTECIKAVKMVKEAGWDVVVSTHGSGETEDDFIVDLSVGLGADQIKIGVPCKPERSNMYIRLCEIERELNRNAVYAGERLCARL